MINSTAVLVPVTFSRNSHHSPPPGLVGISRPVVKNAGLTLNKSIYSGLLRATLGDRLEYVKFGVEGLSGLTQGPGAGAYLSVVFDAIY